MQRERLSSMATADARKYISTWTHCTNAGPCSSMFINKSECLPNMAHAGAFYMRLVGRPLEVYQYLEPLYNDYRKVR